MATIPGGPCAASLRRALGAVSACALLCLSSFPLPAHAAAGDTLAAVKSRGNLRCGVADNSVGFATKDSAGRWSGLDVDFCRALAATALGDAGKVTFVPLRTSERFPALQARTIDLLVRQSTWTLLREGNLKVLFAGVLLYDSQGFLVSANSRIKTPAQLKDSTVCVLKGTTSGQNLTDYSVAYALNIKPLITESIDESLKALVANRCQALSSDFSTLAGLRLQAPGGADAYVILPERISKEPLGPAVRAGDDDWFTLVRWVLFALIGAEEAGITRENVDRRATEAWAQRIMGRSEHFGQALGVDDDWVLWIVRSVGNYGEIYERNLGSNSPLKIERGLNRLWSDGGLMYSPPFR